MAEIDIELDGNLIEAVKRLAVRHYGDSGDACIYRVFESAFKMRLLSIELTENGGNEIEEPISNWEFANDQSAERLLAEVTDWLFRRR